MIERALILKFLRFCIVGSSGMAWTFKSENARIVAEYLSFVTISVIGLGINNLVVYLLTEKFRFYFYLSKLFAIGVVTLWNFIMNYIFTFSQPVG